MKDAPPFAKTERGAAQQALYEASGRVESESKLTAFLYLLMRDYVKVGDVGTLLHNLPDGPFDGPYDFTNGWLAEYAQYVASQLTKKRTTGKMKKVPR